MCNVTVRMYPACLVFWVQRCFVIQAGAGRNEKQTRDQCEGSCGRSNPSTNIRRIRFGSGVERQAQAQRAKLAPARKFPCPGCRQSVTMRGYTRHIQTSAKCPFTVLPTKEVVRGLDVSCITTHGHRLPTSWAGEFPGRSELDPLHLSLPFKLKR